MAARSRTTPSTRRLSEVARHVVVPTGIVSTGWPAVEAKCAEWGDSFDAWQAGLGRVILGKRADDLYAATVGGVTLSIPRQVAKTFLVMRIVFALCAIFPGLRVLWTAHHTATLSNTFRSFLGFARRKKVAPLIEATYRGSGAQAIVFRNGSEIYFGAREQGFGRGFDEVDVEVFDEAQILTEKALEDMVAATNQSRHQHGALLFYMGTPPRPTDPGEAFTLRRKAALAAKPDWQVYAEHGDAVYVECSADANVGRPGGPSLDDRDQLRRANPSYPHRTPEASIQRLRANLPADDSWRREGLGVWDSDDAGTGVVDMARWSDRFAPAEDVSAPIVLVVETTGDRSRTVLVVVASRPDGVPQVEVIDSREGTAWVPARVADVAAADGVSCVVMDPTSAARSLIPDVRTALDPLGVELVEPKAQDVAEAFGLTFDAIHEGGLVHLGEPQLTAAVESAQTRPLGDGGMAWSRRKGGPTIAPLVAMTLGLWRWAQLTSEEYDVLDSIG